MPLRCLILVVSRSLLSYMRVLSSPRRRGSSQLDKNLSQSWMNNSWIPAFAGMTVIVTILTITSTALASPWLPQKNQYQYITSAYFMDKKSIKTLKKESKVYYVAEQEIFALESTKEEYKNDPNLTKEAVQNRITEIDGRVKNLRRIQSYFSDYYSKTTASQYVEYGISDNSSMGAKVFYQTKGDFAGRHRDNIGFELFQKFKVWQNDKYTVSFQPLVGMHRDIFNNENIYGELWILGGKTKITKFGKTFDIVAIGAGASRQSPQYKAYYTKGLEMDNGIMLLLQTYNSFKPKVHKIYKQTSLEQFSVAKPAVVSIFSVQSKITMQIGYFQEFSISAKKSIGSGVQLSIWVEI